MKESVRWLQWLPWVILGAFTALWCARWPSFPFVLDPYYHLLVARQIADAGGPIAYEWWEYAPIGRPHLYPPVLHLLLAAFLKIGCPALVAIRLLTAALPPVLLLTIFLVTRRLLTPTLALSCLGISLLPFSFHLHSAITMAATLGMITLLWLYDALERGRPLAAGLLLALLGYTHLGLPWIALVSLGVVVLLRPPLRRTVLKAGWGLILTLPWYAHLFSHRSFLHPFPRQENTMVELLPLIYLTALMGFWRCRRLKGPCVWLLGCWAGFTLLAPHYPYRWLSGEGMLPIVLLAGVGVHGLVERLHRTVRCSKVAAACSVLVVLACSPTLMQDGAGWRWRWPDSAPWHLLGASTVVRKDVEASFSFPQLSRLVDDVVRQTQPNEIIWSNASYAIGLVAALAHRPSASAMLNEVTPGRAFDPIGAAHLIVWFKFEDIPGAVRAATLARYPVIRVHENDLAVLFRQTGVVETARKPEAVFPFGVAMALIGASIVAVAVDLRRPGQNLRTPV